MCGCGGSDKVKGDRLRENIGDCFDSNMIQGDVTRVEAALKSLSALSSIGDLKPDVIQVSK